MIDPYQRVYGYPTMSVMDGAAISANLGVNPSLSITAQAERAASLWPNKGEADLRPAQGEPYRRLTRSRRASRGARRCIRRVAPNTDRTWRKGQFGRLNTQDGVLHRPCVRPTDGLAALRCQLADTRAGRRRDGPCVTGAAAGGSELAERSSPTTVISPTSGRLRREPFVLALQQPVAGDLRKVVCALHVGADIERMGAMAVHVANIARLRHPEQALPDEVGGSFTEMSHVAVHLARRRGRYCCRPMLRKERNCARRTTSSTPGTASVRRGFDREWRQGVCSVVDVALLGRLQVAAVRRPCCRDRQTG